MSDCTCVHKGKMKEHVDSVHEKKNPFKCENCAKNFFLNHYLKVHDMLHPFMGKINKVEFFYKIVKALTT